MFEIYMNYNGLFEIQSYSRDFVFSFIGDMGCDSAGQVY